MPEEELLFENHTTLNRSTCRDFQALTWRKNGGRLRWLLWGAGAVALVYGAALLWQEGSARLLYATGLFLMAAVALALAAWGWRLRLPGYIAAQQAAWGGETLDKTLRFTRGGIRQQSALGPLQFSWRQLTGLTIGTRVLLLWLGDDVILLARSGFTTGSAAAFEELVRGVVKQNKGKRR